MKNLKSQTKVKCPCGKYNWIPNYYIKRGIGKYCDNKCASKYKNKKEELTKYSTCERCDRRYLTKLGCLFHKT